MKYLLIAVTILVVSGVLLVYTTMVLPPKSDGEIISLNLAAVLIEVSIVCGAFFSLIHMTVDLAVNKMIKLNNAVRRGMFFGVLVAGLLWMRINGVLSWLLALLLTLVFVVTEIVVNEIKG